MFIWPPAPEMGVPPVYVGVFVQKITETRLHAGIIYRTAQSGASVLHLMGHYDLRREPPTVGQLCVLCPIEPVRVPALAVVFNRLFKSHKERGLRIPYGFKAPAYDIFSNLQNLDPGLGLCCQSFVLKAYQTAEIILIEPIDAPVRNDDAARQQAMLDEWKDQIAASDDPRTKAHFDEVQKHVGSPVYRPLEVGGAAMANALPCNFETALHNATELEKQMVV